MALVSNETVLGANGENSAVVEIARLLGSFARALARSTSVDATLLALYRPMWDDFEVVAVETPDDVLHSSLASVTDPHEAWQAALATPKLRLTAYVVPEEAMETLALGREVRRRHPDAQLVVVPVAGRDDVVLGLLAVVLLSDHALTAGEAARLLDAAEAIGIVTALGHAAVMERERAEMLEEFLSAENRLSEELPIRLMLELWCTTVQRVAGFQNVFVGIYDPAPDREGFRFRCAVGWRDADDPSHQLLTRNHVAPLLDRRFIVEGCALVPFEAVSAVFPQVEAGGFLSAPGPQAWHDHWLFVPLHGSAGELIGIARLDEPLDLLLPSQEKLRALRLFSNHLSQAVVLRRVRSRLTRAATTDPLTRLPNRRSFAARIATETARAARYGRPCALIVIDLDRLKSINDAKGHDAGDAALVALGHVIGSHMRAGDSAFRIGGDEFALLLPETTAREAESAASRIRDTLASLDEPLNASFGIAVAPVDATDPALLIRLADEAMYADKARKSQRS